jgi:hypothetical protein
MSEMGSHDPFGQLKHKLWPKEGLAVKLAIWLPTTKIQKSPRFPYVLVVCNISLKSSQQGLQLCFRPHFNRRSAHKVMGPQSRGSPKFGNFEIPSWESWAKMPFGCWLWLDIEYTIRGNVVASPKSGPWWVLWVCGCSWFVLAPKVLKLCINQLVVWFVQVRVSDWLLVIFPSLILELQHTPLPPKCYELGSAPQLLLLLLSSPLNSLLNPLRSLGVHH